MKEKTDTKPMCEDECESKLRAAWKSVPMALKLSEQQRATFAVAWRLAWNASSVEGDRAMIEQFCSDLNQAHNTILKLQGIKPEDFGKYDWPEWTPQANSIRWAEKRLQKRLAKTEKGSSVHDAVCHNHAEANQGAES